MGVGGIVGCAVAVEIGFGVAVRNVVGLEMGWPVMEGSGVFVAVTVALGDTVDVAMLLAVCLICRTWPLPSE